MQNTRLAVLCFGLACVALWPRQLFTVPQVSAPHALARLAGQPQPLAAPAPLAAGQFEAGGRAPAGGASQWGLVAAAAGLVAGLVGGRRVALGAGGQPVKVAEPKEVVVGSKPWYVEKPDAIELIKRDSNYHRAPLLQELNDLETSGLSKAGGVIMKHHGSYVQTNREIKAKKADKVYQFMFRLKVPAGTVPAGLFRLLDQFCEDYGQNDLRITTRQAFQIHGILKADLKEVVSGIMNFGSSTISGCGDVSRNVMVPPAPINSILRPEYRHAREWAYAIADLFKPQSTAFSEIWLDGEKAASVEYWKKDYPEGVDPVAAAKVDTGKGIILDDPVEPIYGDQYLPKKFKIAVTVPTDNSVDLYINDIGCVVITDPKKGGEVEGFNIVVGGGLGRTHKKEATFARAADHLGFVPKDKFMETLKAILAAQRDHGNREVRSNARMKYLVHKLGIDKFRDLVHSYLPEPCIEEWRELPPWEYKDWMGWHEQGDGKLFLGLPIDSGRVRDFENGPQIKSALRAIVDRYDTDLILSPTQSIMVKDIEPRHKVAIEELLAAHSVKLVEEIDALDRLAMSCPALPLCGLAMTEAERVMQQYTERIRAQLRRSGLGSEDIMIRMTGCPNGCARPYMAELAYVGDGQKSYQLWVGGSPALDGRTGFPLKDKVQDATMEETLAPLFAYWKEARTEGEAFGDFTHRIGKEALLAYIDGYTLTATDLAGPADEAESDSDVSISPVVTQDELRATMAKGDSKDDIACEIDKLDYLQVIPECRDDEPAAKVNGAAPAAAAKAPAPAPAAGKFSDVSAFRMFKGNQQWRVRWTADGAESWETFDKMDSDALRQRALEIQAATK